MVAPAVQTFSFYTGSIASANPYGRLSKIPSSLCSKTMTIFVKSIISSHPEGLKIFSGY